MKNKEYLTDLSYQKDEISYQSKIYIRVISAVILFFILYLISQDNYLLYHEVIEISSIAIASGIFLIIWNSYRRLDNHFFLILAIGIIFSAFFDFLHMFSYKGIAVFQFNSYDPSNLATQLWLVARIIQAGTYLTATFFLSKISRVKVFVSYCLISIFFIVIILPFPIFPVAYVDGHLTLFKKIAESFITLIFLIASAFVYSRRAEFDKSVFRLLIASFIVTIFSELAFTLCKLKNLQRILNY